MQTQNAFQPQVSLPDYLSFILDYAAALSSGPLPMAVNEARAQAAIDHLEHELRSIVQLGTKHAQALTVALLELRGIASEIFGLND
jgi:nitrate reductase assembly molybdenum cofactor insertion protein NarJ